MWCASGGQHAGRKTISTVTWKHCPSVAGSDGVHTELIGNVEAIIDAACLSYIVPPDLATEIAS